MKRRIPVILAAVWLAAVIVVMIVRGNVWFGDMPDSVSLSTSIERGSSFEDLYKTGDSVTALLRLKSSDEEYLRCRIAEISSGGETVSVSPVLKLDPEITFSDFVSASDGFYLTFIAPDSLSAEVYFVDRSCLLTPGEEEEAEPMEPSLLGTFGEEEETAINWASYENGSFRAWRADGSGIELYEKGRSADEECMEFIMDAGQSAKESQYSLLHFAALLIGGWVLIAVVYFALRSRSGTTYMIVMVETVLFIVIAAGVVLTARYRNSVSESEAQEFAYYYMDALLDTSDNEYDKLSERITDSDLAGSGKDVYTDICVVDGGDHVILASVSGRNGIALESFYEKNSFLWDSRGDEEEWRLVTVMPQSRSLAAAVVDTPGFLVSAVILFVIGTAVCLIVLLYQGRELRRFSKAIVQVSSGGESPVKGRTHTKDMSVMWNSLMEIQKQISRISYSRNQIFESCYRFAPKNIEKLFGKNSISEVSVGDTRPLKGTVAFVTLDEPKLSDSRSTQKLNRFVSLVEKNQEESGGYFVSGCSDLTELKVLFPGDEGSGSGFGERFMSEFYGKDSIRGEKAGVFLHYTDFIYGVAGNEEQSLPYLEMDSKEQLDRMAGWFRDMGLRLVMTEEVLRQEKYKGSLRYIGYLLLGEKKLKLYEVLDVCPALERRMKLNTDDLFQKALQLFYQHDFYLARGNFSEVLKENATDEMAKWYLFTCEKYLDRPYTEGDVCCLNV